MSSLVSHCHNLPYIYSFKETPLILQPQFLNFISSSNISQLQHKALQKTPFNHQKNKFERRKMDSSMKHSSMILFFACTLFLQGTLGEIICENLPTKVCSFSIASSGKRCLLENSANEDGKMEYQCKTSEVIVGNIAEYIETDECVNACDVDRNSVGISSDALLDPQFTAKLCSPSCYQNCPNVVDLYFNLAAGEGVYLPDLCNKQRSSPHRAMIELLSSGAADADADASAPIASEDIVVGAPDIAPAPASF